MVIDHARESLKVVVAEKAVPERLTFHQQLSDVPGKTDGSGDQKSRQWPEATPETCQVTPGDRKQHQGHARQHHRNRPLGEDSGGQENPGQPPPPSGSSHVTTPLAEQAESQRSIEQGIADGRAAPDQHQGRQPEGQRCRHRRAAGMVILGTGMTHQRVADGEHRHHGGQRRRQTRRPGPERIPVLMTGKGIAQPHQPVNERRFVKTGQTVHPRGQPVAGLSHGPA